MGNVRDFKTRSAFGATNENITFDVAPNPGDLIFVIWRGSAWFVTGFTDRTASISTNDQWQDFSWKIAGESESSTINITRATGGELQLCAFLISNPDVDNLFTIADVRDGVTYSNPFAARTANISIPDQAVIISMLTGVFEAGIGVSCASPFNANFTSYRTALAYLDDDAWTDFYEVDNVNWTIPGYSGTASSTYILINTVSEEPLGFSVIPTVTARTGDSYTIGGTLSAEGNVYGVAVLSTDTAPTTTAQIIAGHNGDNSAARGAGNAATDEDGVFSFQITGASLNANPIHDIHVCGRAGTPD
jgi:hypothetical protein